ncbi:FxsA family protein [Paracoccus caeni]|uniref:FxsA family protein n=1 Tax=Paracoccus caeni TaxID=657651 RepID=A0A934SEX8_9RHOB|nr:FxsA family protein [Paracoccus caeni]MBK4217610.1 FxsA family protein [Paracoccus caeni]
MWLLWLFVALPIIEIALFIQVGGVIGLWATLGLVMLSAVLGMTVVRSQGRHAWLEAQRSLNELRDPSRPLAHGAMIMVAGVLMIIPGLFTSAVGLLLMIPPVRDLVVRWMGRRVRVTHPGGRPRHDAHRPPYGDGVIDGDYVVEDEPVPTRPRMPPDLPQDMSDEDGSSQHPPHNPSKPGKSGWTRH